MAAIVLPPPTRETEIEITELSWAKDMRPTGAGPTQRQDRVGTRHSIEFDIPVKRYAWCGAGLASDLALARTGEGAIIEIPEPGTPEVNYGNPVVNGAPQIGSSISLRGLTPGAVIKKGKWLSLFANNRWYAHFTTHADVVVPAGGVAVLKIYPMIRRSPADGSPVKLAKPVIQGLTKDPVRRKLVRRVGIGLAFAIEEQE